MAKKNITKQVEKEIKEEVLEEPEVIEEVKDVEEEVLEEPEVIVDEIKKESETIKEDVKQGKLTKCESLNARKEPVAGSDILFVINKTDNIKVLEKINDFYKVLVNDEKEAYCVAYFIEV